MEKICKYRGYNMEESIWQINHMGNKLNKLLKPAESLVNSRKMQVMSQWMHEECSKLLSEGRYIFQVSWVYLLTCVSESELCDNSKLELLAWSCISLACKISGFSFDLAYAKDSTEGRVTEVLVNNTELVLCQKLNWNLTVPTLLEIQATILDNINLDNMEEIISLSHGFCDEKYLNFTLVQSGVLPVAFSSILYALQCAEIDQRVLIEAFGGDFSQEILLGKKIIPKY